MPHNCKKDGHKMIYEAEDEAYTCYQCVICGKRERVKHAYWKNRSLYEEPNKTFSL